MFFSASLFRPSEAPLCAKRPPKGPQIELKQALNPLNSQPLDPSKHMVFTDRITLWPVSGELWKQTFWKLRFEHYFFQFFRDFGALGYQNWPQNGCHFRGENQPKSHFSPNRPPAVQKGPRDTKITPKWSPGVRKWSPEEPKKQIKTTQRLVLRAQSHYANTLLA
jgi:hypothetical protein